MRTVVATGHYRQGCRSTRACQRGWAYRVRTLLGPRPAIRTTRPAGSRPGTRARPADATLGLHRLGDVRLLRAALRPWQRLTRPRWHGLENIARDRYIAVHGDIRERLQFEVETIHGPTSSQPLPQHRYAANCLRRRSAARGRRIQHLGVLRLGRRVGALSFCRVVGNGPSRVRGRGLRQES